MIKYNKLQKKLRFQSKIFDHCGCGVYENWREWRLYALFHCLLLLLFPQSRLAVKAIRTAVVKCRLPIFTAGNFCCLIDLRIIYEF